MKISSGLVVLGTASFLALAMGQPTLAKKETGDKTTDTAKHKTVKVKVKAGDTLDAIAKKHHTTYVRLFNANKKITHPDVLNVGDKIRIPGKKEKLPNRFAKLNQAPVAAQPTNYAPATQAASYNYAPSSAPAYRVGSTAGNTYYAGYCTWYAKDRRPDLPNMLGNGGEWTANAARQGFSTGSTARVGAIAETPGHVMYVEKVYGDGTMLISEMNGTAGFGQVGTRRVSTAGTSFIY